MCKEHRGFRRGIHNGYFTLAQQIDLVDTSNERPSRSPLVRTLIGLLAGVGGGILIAALADQVNWSALSGMPLLQELDAAREIMTIWDLLALPVLSMLVLGTHEVGHLLAGKSQGMRFLMLIVGPFGWHASASGIRFEWNTHVEFMGGLAAAAPTNVGASLSRQLLVMTAGGPFTSLLLAVLAVVLASFTDARLTTYLMFVALVSFGIFLVTLIPARNGSFMSDGMQIIDLLRGGNAAIERAALMQIFAQTMDGVRPRDWDSSAIDQLYVIYSENATRNAGIALYLLSRAMDNGQQEDVARYRTQLENNIDQFPSAFKQSVYVELAICAWLAGDTDAVRRHLEAGKGGFVEESRRLLAQAALAKLEGRDENCERDRLLAVKALAKTSDAGQAKLTEDQLAMLGR